MSRVRITEAGDIPAAFGRWRTARKKSLVRIRAPSGPREVFKKSWGTLEAVAGVDVVVVSESDPEGYPCKRETFEETYEVLIVSVGTGTWESRKDSDELMGKTAAMNGVTSLISLMSDTAALNELLLQWLSDSPTNRKIDSEVGDLRNDILGFDPKQEGNRKPWISYLRYNATLELDWLNDNVESTWTFTEDDLEELRDLGSPESMPALTEIGKAAAKQVKAAHFPKAFQLRAAPTS